jgi:two-component system, cell cycle sensor histidine kinase and response regulator CckA
VARPDRADGSSGTDGTVRRIPATAIALVTVSLLAALDLLLAPHVVLLGLLVVGPALAAVSGRPRTVVGIGAYALALTVSLSLPDRLWASTHLLLDLLAVAGVTVVSALVAGRRTVSERFVARAGRHRAALVAVVDSSDDAIIGKTLDGIITSWNAGAQRMYGYSAAEAVGQHISIITSPQEAAEIPGILERIGRGERIDHYETRRRHKNGDVVHVSVSITPIRDPVSGVVLGAWAVARDMTARVRAEAEREAVQEVSAQAQRLQSLGQLAGGVAHDFNNLLSVISNYAAFVAEETRDRPAVQEDVARIRTAAERAAQLTAQLLTFARRETVQPQVLDLNSIVAEVQNLLLRSLGEHVELVVVAGADLPPVRADRGHVEQVIVNLAVNARDAMPDGGTLVVQTRPVRLKAGQPRLRPAPTPGEYVELSVSDTGVGMDAAVAARMFDPFFTTKPKGSGTGLGLSTVYGIVAGSGGSLNVYSEPGIGTTIRVYLPVVHAPLTADPAAEPELLRRGDGETILVAEDEPELRDLIRRILDRNGYTPLIAGPPAHALELVQAHRVDLLLTDVVMPQMSGPELNERIQRHHPGLPVLFLSGYSNGLLTTQRVLDPHVHLVAKPFTEPDLVNEIHAVLASTERHGPVS